MNPKIKTWLKHYLYGLFADAWNNAWNTVSISAFLVGGGVITGSLVKGTLLVLAGAFAKSVVFYFAKNPLPTQLPND